MSKKKEEGFDLFSNFETEANDLWGDADSSDPFGVNKNEDPFALFPTPEKLEEQKETKTTEKASVTPIKSGGKTPAASDKKSQDAKEKGNTKPKTEPKKQIKPEEFDVDATWTVCYAGHQINPSHPMKLEQMRESIEIDFPELSKSRTKWDVSEEKKIAVPIVLGAKMG